MNAPQNTPHYRLVGEDPSQILKNALQLATTIVEQTRLNSKAMIEHEVEKRLKEQLASLESHYHERVHTLSDGIRTKILSAFLEELRRFSHSLGELRATQAADAAATARTVAKELISAELVTSTESLRNRAMALLEHCAAAEQPFELRLSSELHRLVTDTCESGTKNLSLGLSLKEDSSLPLDEMRLITNWGEIRSSPLRMVDQIFSAFERENVFISLTATTHDHVDV